MSIKVLSGLQSSKRAGTKKEGAEAPPNHFTVYWRGVSTVSPVPFQ